MTPNALLIAATVLLAALPAPAQSPATQPAGPGIISFPAGGGRPATAPAGATESVCAAAIDWLDRAGAMVDKLVPVAEEAAGRILAGGTLWVSGNGGFADECDYRAGGFPFTKIWSGEKLGPNDVLLIGCFRPNETESRHASIDFVARGYRTRFGEGTVIHLSSHAWPQIARSLPFVSWSQWGGRLHLIDTGAPVGASAEALCAGQLSAAALGWVLHGEMIAAATRRGKTLSTYASDWEPDGHQWDASVAGTIEHPKYKIKPIAAGVIGRRYLEICRKQIAAFAAAEPRQVRLAADRMAGCMRRGGVVWAVFSGHILGRGAVVPSELTRVKMFGRSYDWRAFSRQVPAGDTILWMGYLRYPHGEARGLKETGAAGVIVAVDPGPTDEKLTHVRGHWADYDTVIDLPGYPIRVLPSSGVVQTAQWYALMAETVAAGKPSR